MSLVACLKLDEKHRKRSESLDRGKRTEEPPFVLDVEWLYKLLQLLFRAGTCKKCGLESVKGNSFWDVHPSVLLSGYVLLCSLSLTRDKNCWIGFWCWFLNRNLWISSTSLWQFAWCGIPGRTISWTFWSEVTYDLPLLHLTKPSPWKNHVLHLSNFIQLFRLVFSIFFADNRRNDFGNRSLRYANNSAPNVPNIAYQQQRYVSFALRANILNCLT